MSERRKPHNGRDLSGQHKVKRVDLDDLQTDPAGPDYLKDDVRLGGAVEDVGARAGEHGARIERLIAEDDATTRRNGDGSRHR